MEALVRRSVAEGGLRELPPDFGDPSGGWSSILSENPFEVLLLDYQNAEAITGEMISGHFDLISRFWEDKLRWMRTSGSRTMILRKYGGEHESEKLVASYPRRLSWAISQIQDQDGFKRVLESLEHRRIGEAVSRIDQRLATYLVDRALRPHETKALFDLAAAERLDLETIAKRIYEALLDRGLRANNQVRGVSLQEQLLSVDWMDPAIAQTKSPESSRKRGVGLGARVTFIGVGVVVAFVAIALIVREGRPASRDTAVPNGDLAATTSSVGKVVPPLASADLARPSESPLSELKPAGESKMEIEARMRREAAAAARRNSLAECRALLADLAGQIEGLVAGEQLDEARSRVEEVSAKCSQFGPELPGQSESFSLLRRHIEDASVQSKLVAIRAAQAEKEWQGRVTEIDDHLAHNRLIEAQSAADRLVSAPGVPADIAESAKSRSAEAKKRLEDAFKDFKPDAQSKTVRPVKPPGGG